MDVSKARLVGLHGVDLALDWAQEGHRVLPVAPAPAKRPLIKAWQDQCSTDPDLIRAWWYNNDNARVGIATGKPGFDVLDFDVADGKPGMEQLEKLLDLGIIEPGTFRVVATPSGGQHLYFRGTEQRNKQNEKAIPGVDFRGQGGMVLAAGNPGYRYVSGASLGWEDLAEVDWEKVRAALAPPPPEPVVPTTPLAPPPTSGMALPGTWAPQPPPGPPRGSQRANRLVGPKKAFDDPVGEESPLDWYTRNHDIEELLRGAGWQFVNESGGRRHYRRPGKETDVSGNVHVMADGRTVFYNFSSSVGLPTDTALSTAQLYAHLEHGGDLRTAAAYVRRTLMPQRTPLPSSPVTYGPTGGTPMGVPPSQSVPVAPEPGTDLVPMSLYNPPQMVRDFWKARPELREIWFQAGETDYSPWAILGYALAMVNVRVGPHVQLPPRNRKYGGPASLNMFVAIVGDTGDGKDEASKLARPFIGPPKVPTRKPGTGQGIAALYTEMNPKEGPVQVNDTAYLHESEITGLGAHSDMQGSNLVSTLLSVYMAQELGEHYANKEKRRPVPEGRYRLALTVGVQPSNSHVLLDEERAASGLPQRFLWMPAIWPDSIYNTRLKAPAPGWPIKPWRAWSAILPGSLDDMQDATGWSPSDAAGGLKSPVKEKASETQVPFREPVIIEYAPELWTEIERVRRARSAAAKARKLNGERSAGTADSHVMLTQLKVAAMLSIWLDQSLIVSWEMWQLASCVMWISDRMRIESSNELREKGRDAVSRRAGTQAAVTAIVKASEDADHKDAVTQAATRLRHLLSVKGDGDGWCSVSVLNRAMSSTEKKKMKLHAVETGDVLDDMVLLGIVETREPVGAEQGTRWRLKP